MPYFQHFILLQSAAKLQSTIDTSSQSPIEFSSQLVKAALIIFSTVDIKQITAVCSEISCYHDGAGCAKTIYANILIPRPRLLMALQRAAV